MWFDLSSDWLLHNLNVKDKSECLQFLCWKQIYWQLLVKMWTTFQLTAKVQGHLWMIHIFQNRIPGSLHHLTLIYFDMVNVRESSLQAWPWQPGRMFSSEYFGPNCPQFAWKLGGYLHTTSQHLLPPPSHSGLYDYGQLWIIKNKNLTCMSHWKVKGLESTFPGIELVSCKNVVKCDKLLYVQASLD